ncbi:MAG TPA: MXAN_6640 family putative metalloprotease [Solirubrobacterales bacterium]|nr:MXAN_6640 family putative metalloprotease [Solirubrobacterales bacterium]
MATASARAGDRADARSALETAERLLEPGASPARTTGPTREATLVLRELSNGLGTLRGRDRRRAEAILARPTERADRFGDYFGNEAASSPVCDADFCVHWSRSERHAPAPADADQNGTPDYVDDVLAAAATSRAVENGTLGWRPAKPDGETGARRGKGGSGQVDVYVRDLGRNIFGYAASDPRVTGRSRSGYLVIDNDYARFTGEPLDLMRVTIAHEYNHILQFAYDSFQDEWLFESTATWVEDHVFGEINDYVNFLDAFARRPHKPLAEPNRRPVRLYGSAMWNHWLAARHGTDVVRSTWEGSRRTNPISFAVAAYDRAIAGAGGSSFSREFAAFAAASAEWNALRSFPDAGSYPDMRRSGRLQGARKLRLDHTTYRLFKVKGGGRKVLAIQAARGTRSGVALVGRRGGSAEGSVTIRSKYLPRGGRAVVSLPDAGKYSRVTALVINADGRSEDGRRYSRDNRRFKVRLRG